MSKGSHVLAEVSEGLHEFGLAPLVGLVELLADLDFEGGQFVLELDDPLVEALVLHDQCLVLPALLLALFLGGLECAGELEVFVLDLLELYLGEVL